MSEEAPHMDATSSADRRDNTASSFWKNPSVPLREFEYLGEGTGRDDTRGT